MPKVQYYRDHNGRVRITTPGAAVPCIDGEPPELLTRAAGAAEYRAQAAEQLRKYAPKGATIYTIIRGTPAASGMSRRISLFTVHNGAIIALDYHASIVLQRKEHDKGGIQIGGCGMDMGFALVYDLSHALYNAPNTLNHTWM